MFDKLKKFVGLGRNNADLMNVTHQLEAKKVVDPSGNGTRENPYFVEKSNSIASFAYEVLSLLVANANNPQELVHNEQRIECKWGDEPFVILLVAHPSAVFPFEYVVSVDPRRDVDNHLSRQVLGESIRQAIKNNTYGPKYLKPEQIKVITG